MTVTTARSISLPAGASARKMMPSRSVLDLIPNRADQLALLAKLESRMQPIPFCGCLVGTGGHDGNYYNKISVKGVDLMLHRVLYELRTGERIPHRHFLDHECKVHSCGEQSHLTPLPPHLNTAKGNAIMYRRAHAYA